MFNIAVIKIEDIIRYIMIIIIVIFSITILKNLFIEKINIGGEIKNYSEALTKVLPKIENKDIDTNKEKKEKIVIGAGIKSISYVKEIDKDQLRTAEENESKAENTGENIKKEIVENIDYQKDKIEKIEEKNNKVLPRTEIITPIPLKDKYNLEYGKVKIKNQTDCSLTKEDLKPDIDIKCKDILIFHTHTCESYTASEKNKYKASGNFRSTDLQYSVARVGDELENSLNKKGYKVIHDKTYHDYPAYNGSYTRSLKTVEQIKQNDSVDIIFDIHRDAIGSMSDYAPTVKIGEEEAAQIMFVIGTNQGGLWHPNWKNNLKFAIKVQEKAEEMYPGLFKTMMLTKARYNQHAGKYASIIEVGATGNTLEQSINSMKYLANVLDEVLK